MPNWCDTEYIVKGDIDQLSRLHDLMLDIESGQHPGLIKSDFGATWLGNLVKALGEDPFTIGRCRGWWHDMEFDMEQSELHFWTTTAWCEADDTRHLIERNFPDIKFYFMSEEAGCGYWVTNDVDADYFSDRYYIVGEREDSLWLSSLESLINFTEEYSHAKDLRTFEDCVKAIRSVPDSYNDYRSIQEVTIVE